MFADLLQTKFTSVAAEVLYLDGLSVVGFYNMEVEAVHASSWCQEDAALLVKVSTHVHQNLTQEQGKEEGMMRCDLHAIVYRTVGLLSKGFPACSRVLSCPSLIDFRYFADFSKH